MTIGIPALFRQVESVKESRETLVLTSEVIRKELDNNDYLLIL